MRRGPGSRKRPGQRPGWISLEDLGRYGELSSWVLGTAGVLILGIWGGSAADRRFGTSPWLTLAGTLLAVLWAVSSLIREVLRLQDRRRR